MTDVILILVIGGFFAVMAGYVRFADALRHREAGK